MLLSLVPNGQALYSQDTLKEILWDFFKFEHSLDGSINFCPNKLRTVKRALITLQKGMHRLEVKLEHTAKGSCLCHLRFYPQTNKLSTTPVIPRFYLPNPLTWPLYSTFCISVWWVTSQNNTKGKQKCCKETLSLKHSQFYVTMKKSGEQQIIHNCTTKEECDSSKWLSTHPRV